MNNINHLVREARKLLRDDRRVGLRPNILHEWLEGNSLAARAMVTNKYGPGLIRRVLREEAIRWGGFDTAEGALFFSLRESVAKDPRWRRAEGDQSGQSVPYQRKSTGRRSKSGDGARG